jgi:hypothetical protein
MSNQNNVRKLISDLVAVIDDFLPNIGKCVLQDYGRLNTALIEAREFLLPEKHSAESNALQIAERAKELYASDVIELDDVLDAHQAEQMLSRGDDGVWVKAWVFVANQDLTS